VRLPTLDDGEVGENAPLKDIGLAVELLVLLALGDDRADAGPRVEAGDAGAAGTATLGKGALRAAFNLELAGEILPLELLVLADIGGDHLPHLARAQQLAEPFAVDAGIVRGDGELLDTRIPDRLDQPLGNAAQAEAPGADHHAVEQQPVQ